MRLTFVYLDVFFVVANVIVLIVRNVRNQNCLPLTNLIVIRLI